MHWYDFIVGWNGIDYLLVKRTSDNSASHDPSSLPSFLPHSPPTSTLEKLLIYWVERFHPWQAQRTPSFLSQCTYSAFWNSYHLWKHVICCCVGSTRLSSQRLLWIPWMFWLHVPRNLISGVRIFGAAMGKGRYPQVTNRLWTRKSAADFTEM